MEREKLSISLMKTSLSELAEGELRPEGLKMDQIQVSRRGGDLFQNARLRTHV